MYRKTYIEIDEEILKNNVKNIRENYNSYKYFFGVVKGNAYGHGFHTVNALISGGINYLAVATPEEALKVREFNKEIPVLCLEPADESAVEIMAKNNITFTVDSIESLNNLLKTNADIKVHIKIDSGMNRLGFKNPEELENAYRLMINNEKITIEGIFSHFATSGINDSYYNAQINNFLNIVKEAGIDLKDIPIVHLDRSLTFVHHKKAEFVNGIRIGICMYGFSQSLTPPTGLKKIKRNLFVKNKSDDIIFKNNLQLQTAMKFYSTVIAVKKISKSEFAGYGAEYISSENGYVATIAAGYYDGIPSGLKSVAINGKKYEIIGEHCMDMICIKADESIKIGDRVEIFGDTVSVKQAAASSHISSYKLLCGVSSRVPRIYDDEELYI